MFFSVRNTIKIAGKVYKPCICYEVNNTLALTVDKLVAEGKADVHEEYAYFCNGKVVEEKKEAIEEAKPATKAKNEKKEKKVPQVDTVEEDIPSPEEIANNEGF